MATSAPPPDGSFPRPPRSFEDEAGRQIAVAAVDGGGGALRDDLAAMYAEFPDADRSQGLPPRDEARRREWVATLLDDGINVLARHGDRVVGHAVLVPFDGMAELAIFVHPDYQRAGVGSRLVRALLGAGERAGVERVWLCVGRSNVVAVNLYRSVGFETTSEGVELEMELSLGGVSEGAGSS